MHGCSANGHCSQSYRKSGVEKRPSRFSFIRAEAFIPHPFGCNKRYESRLQFLMRTQSAAYFTRHGGRVASWQNGCVFLRSKNTVVNQRNFPKTSVFGKTRTTTARNYKEVGRRKTAEPFFSHRRCSAIPVQKASLRAMHGMEAVSYLGKTTAYFCHAKIR